jgi:uncharacterized protein (TIGR00369 family)
MQRSRQYQWQDPDITAKAASASSGLEFLQAMIDGRLPGPPLMAALGMSLDEVAHGRAVFSVVPGEQHYNPIGSVHGGIYATLLDSAAGCAVHTTLPAGTGYTSVDLAVKFIKRITVDTGTVRAVGTVLSAGRRTALAEARLLDSEDRLLAHATSTCMLMSAAP